YIMILAAIGPVAMIVAFAGLGVAFSIRTALVAYVNSLIGVTLLALVVDLLAPTFGGHKDYASALRLTAYSFTAVWVAEIALVVPIFGWLVVLIAAIYAFYLFMLGAPHLRKCTADRAIPFTIVVLLCSIVLSYLIQRLLYGMAFGGEPLGAAGMMPLLRY
ncbi:MAG TPA: YIP1 family protein, partial [Casimicrobiaceae bacterium]|nr:YIP1 family protein [Casimicrobiaceae bacterium]